MKNLCEKKSHPIEGVIRLGFAGTDDAMLAGNPSALCGI